MSDEDILNVLLDETPEVENKPIYNINSLKKFLINNINTLSYDKKKEIVLMLIENNYKEKLADCSEGIIINIDIVSENIIILIYNRMYKLIEGMNKQKL